MNLARRSLLPLHGSASPSPVSPAAIAHCLIALVLGLAIGGSQALAEQDAFEFVRAAQERGYGEAAIDFLEKLKSRGALPEDLAETWDLEMSRSWRAAMREAYNAAEADQRLAKAQQYLDKFLKEHPNHSAAAEALGTWGDIFAERGANQLVLARRVSDPAQKQKHLDAARKEFEQAAAQFAKSKDLYEKRYTATLAAQREKQQKIRGPRGRRGMKPSEALLEAKLDWIEARKKQALLDYSIAQTYADPKDKKRVELLEKAAKQFDAIFQENRGAPITYEPHAYQGKIAAELGDDQLALDIYDEVLAYVPEDRKDRSQSGFEHLFAKVELFRLEIVRRKDGIEPFIVEASEWLKAHAAWRKIDGYQGIAFELAKAYLEKAEKAPADSKEKLKREAVALLGEMAKVPSEYQADAILLARKFRKAAPIDPLQAKTFEDAMALAGVAEENSDWASAVAGFRHALKLSEKVRVKDKQRVSQAHLHLQQNLYRQASALSTGGKYQEAMQMFDSLVNEYPTSALAPQASAAAVHSALNIFSTSKDKEAALKQLNTAANKTIERFGSKAEADDARLALGQANLLQGNTNEAIKRFEAVDPHSERYPAALYLAGQTHWVLYLRDKQQAGPKDEAAMKLHRSKALEDLAKSVALQKTQAKPGKALADAQLTLGELYVEGKDFNKAADLLLPMVEQIRASKPESLDKPMLRTFIGAVQASIGKGDIKQAGEVADVLLKSGADIPPVNAALSSFARSLQKEYKLAEAGARENPELKTKQENLREILRSVVGQLAQRKQQSPQTLLYIADLSTQVGSSDLAGPLYDRVLELSKSDPSLERYKTLILARRAGLLRTQGKFEQAVADMDALISKNKRALEPLMEKGKILEQWAVDLRDKQTAKQGPPISKDKVGERFAAAAAHWADLRSKLGRLRNKPPDYYEVVYRTASCLYAQHQLTGDVNAAKQAEQLLSATMVLSPRLNGPEMVERYESLLKQIRGPTAQATRVSSAK